MTGSTSSQVGSTKNRSGWTIPVDGELSDWITKWVPNEAFLQGRLLFENPDAYNSRKAWTETRLRTAWYKACDEVLGRRVPPYRLLKQDIRGSDTQMRGESYRARER
jgi:hypothetical protein